MLLELETVMLCARSKELKEQGSIARRWLWRSVLRMPIWEVRLREMNWVKTTPFGCLPVYSSGAFFYPYVGWLFITECLSFSGRVHILRHYEADGDWADDEYFHIGDVMLQNGEYMDTSLYCLRLLLFPLWSLFNLRNIKLKTDKGRWESGKLTSPSLF